MTRAEAWFSHVSNVLVGGTGLVYAWMVYFAEPDDPFAVANHPLQPTLQHWHVLCAPLLVFACGLFWTNHVWRRVRSGFPARRKTGLSLFGLFAPMVVSGYLLQVAGSQTWRTVWVVVHVATSCIWMLAYVVHQLSPRGKPQPGVRG